MISLVQIIEIQSRKTHNSSLFIRVEYGQAFSSTGQNVGDVF